MAYDRGVVTPFNSSGVIVTPIDGIAINWFVNRTPLLARLPQAPVGAPSFKVTVDNFRPRTTTLTANIDNAVTAIPVADGSSFLEGDMLDIDGENFEVQSISGNTLTVGTRGSYGSAAAAHVSATAVVYLIGNSRTGGEVSVNGISRQPVTVSQYLQTFQFPFSISGALESTTEYALPPGVQSVVGRERMMAMQHCADDFEVSSYYGGGMPAGSSSGRPKQYGLRSLIATNNTPAPTNAGGYRAADLVRDTMEKCFASGGRPDLLIVSTDWMTGLTIWGQAAQRLDAGSTEFGVPIDLFHAPFLAGINIIPAPLLRKGTAICLSSGEVRLRVKRKMFEKPRGSRGDAVEADVIMEAAIEVDNESHHAWVSGVTAFSAT